VAARIVTDAVWRDVHRGRVWRAQACRIVEETPDVLAVWFPRTAPARLPVDAHGGRIRIPRDEWELEQARYDDDAQCVARPGRAHSIYLLFRGPRVRVWYVNFEEPLRRTPIGVDTFDHKLDLLVFPSGGHEWKDEDELDQAAALGLVDADAVWAEARRVLREWPFPTGWEGWRPDPSWPVPQLPPGWDVV
jgi:uncharacterized protein